MSTVIYVVIILCISFGVLLALLAFTKPGSFLSIILKPISDRFQKRFERKMVEEEAKLNKAREDMQIAREKAYASALDAEEAERRYRVALSPEYQENIKLKKISKLVEENEKIRQRIDELKKRQ
jgi:hypothetical protein